MEFDPIAHENITDRLLPERCAQILQNSGFYSHFNASLMKALLLSLGLLVSAPVFAGDIDVGRAGATVCAGCHGLDGKSTTPGFPNLAGQDETYLKNQLIAFRDKSRTGGQAVIMYGMAAGLSDQDIENLAGYFSSLKP